MFFNVLQPFPSEVTEDDPVRLVRIDWNINQ